MPPYVTRGSWYSQLPAFGWFDREDRPGSAALGVPDWQQGIALPSRATLGKWFNVTPPGGGIPYPMQQTDIGPAKWTGRGVDISAAAAHQMGYTPRTFPTNAPFSVEPRDEPRGLGSPAGMPVQAGDMPDNTDDTPYAPGPGGTARTQQGPKMPTSLMDMFQPTDAGGEPVDFGKALQSRSNSLIGLGLGLMSPAWQGQSVIGNALQGYQAGAAQDTAQARFAQQMAHTKTQDARQAAQDAFHRQMAEKQFTRSGEGDFSKVARELGIAPNTPEYAAAAQKYYQGKTEGDWTIAQAPHPTYPGETVPVWANKRTRETVPFTPGSVAPDGATTAPGPTQPGAAPPAGGIPPAPPGSDPKEWRKEQTKLEVQRRTAEELRKRNVGAIDPVTEDIDRAINQTKQYPGMIAGTFGNLMKNIPGSQARDVAGLIDTIKANASLDKLQQMRAQSPTGASGLGAVTQGEHKLLQDSIGALDQSQTPEQFLYNLDRVKRVRHEIVNGPGTAPPPQFQPPASQRAPQQSAPGPATPRPGFVKGGYVFKGGDPSDQNNWAPVK